VQKSETRIIVEWEKEDKISRFIISNLKQCVNIVSLLYNF